MIPSRWSSAIAILRRRQAYAAAEERALRRRVALQPDDRQHDGGMSPALPASGAPDTRSLPRRLVALLKQLTGG